MANNGEGMVVGGKNGVCVFLICLEIEPCGWKCTAPDFTDEMEAGGGQKGVWCPLHFFGDGAL